MRLLVYLLSAYLLVFAAFIVFRLIVPRDYLRKGRLSPFSSFLELLVWALFFGFPYLYNPPEWAWFWSPAAPVGVPLRIVGIAFILAGLVGAFGTMLWFGLRRAFGLQMDRLVRDGPYRYSRNPQLVGGAFLVLGTFILWPSGYAAGWMILYGILAHLMVQAEEAHLRNLFGEEYLSYMEHVPRYFGLRRG